jgi:hypothetical protein
MKKAADQGKYTILLDNYLVSRGDKATNYDHKWYFDYVGVHYITITSSISVHGQDMRFQWWDHRENHPATPFQEYSGTISNLRKGAKGWWIISRKP